MLAAAAALALTGCVTFVAPYDEKIDDMATNLQREISMEIETLSTQERPDCLYPNHIAFYLFSLLKAREGSRLFLRFL